MKICDNGVCRDMTAEEIAGFEKSFDEVEQEPTLEERLAALEAAMLEQLLGGAVNV